MTTPTQQAVRESIESLHIVGWLIDPGAGSAMDRVQRNEPSIEQYSDIAHRQGYASALCKVSDAKSAIAASAAREQALREAAEAVLSNEEHAFSGGMRKYQKGSPTWQVYEDLRAALNTSTTKDAG